MFQILNTAELYKQNFLIPLTKV